MTAFASAERHPRHFHVYLVQLSSSPSRILAARGCARLCEKSDTAWVPILPDALGRFSGRLLFARLGQWPDWPDVRSWPKQAGLGSSSRVLDIGSGVGGPARYLAYQFGCHVTALELQPALHTIAADLTQRSGLDERVTHICADALTYAFPDAAFDAVVSWLAFLHIPDRPRLCTRLARTLRAGGGCYVEDLCIRAPFSVADLRVVRDVVFGVSMTSIE